MSLPVSAVTRYTLRGPQLLVSESVVASGRPGALYRDTVLGRFVVFARQTNASGRILRVGLALSNPGPFTVVIQGLTLAARADGVRYRAAPRPERLVLHPGGHVLWGVPLAPSGQVILTARAAPLFPDQGIGAVLDRLGIPAPVIATLYSAPAKPMSPAQLPVLPLSRGGLRATFPHAYAVASGPAPAPPFPVPHLFRGLSDPWPAGSDMVDGRTVFDRRFLGVTALPGRVLPARSPTRAGSLR